MVLSVFSALDSLLRLEHFGRDALHLLRRDRAGRDADAELQRHGEDEILVQFVADRARVFRRHGQEEAALVRQGIEAAFLRLDRKSVV